MGELKAHNTSSASTVDALRNFPICLSLAWNGSHTEKSCLDRFFRKTQELLEASASAQKRRMTAKRYFFWKKHWRRNCSMHAMKFWPWPTASLSLSCASWAMSLTLCTAQAKFHDRLASGPEVSSTKHSVVDCFYGRGLVCFGPPAQELIRAAFIRGTRQIYATNYWSFENLHQTCLSPPERNINIICLRNSLDSLVFYSPWKERGFLKQFFTWNW